MNPDPHTQAPSQEVWQRPFVRTHRKWCDDFVLELRLLDVAGRVVGDRLGEVEVHCAATGETPAEAFGDPSAYATEIAQESAEEPVTGVWKVTVLSVTQVAATLVGTAAVTAWARGEELSYNLVQVGLLGLFALALLRHPWAVGAPLGAGIPLLALAAAFSARLELPVALRLPSAPVALGLFVLVLVLARIEYRELVRDLDGDLVTSPLSPEPAPTTAGGNRRRWTVLAPAGLIPLAYLVLGLFGWITA